MKVYVGVDGGGTYTRAIALSADGRVLGRAQAGPANWQVVGTQGAVESVRAAVLEAAEAAEIAGVGACLAGIDLPEDEARLKAPLELALGCPVAVENDIAAALYAAAEDAVGVVSSGTGAAVALRAGGITRRLLALNSYTGPQGGAGDIAEMALRTAILSAQGAAPPTRLAQEIPRAFGLGDYMALARATQEESLPGWQVALVVAPLCARLAAEGDEAARGVLRRCGALLGETAGRFFAGQGLPTGAPVELHGSLLRDGPKDYRGAFQRALRRFAKGPLRAGRLGALFGAGIFALGAFGVDTEAARRAFEEDA